MRQKKRLNKQQNIKRVPESQEVLQPSHKPELDIIENDPDLTSLAAKLNATASSISIGPDFQETLLNKLLASSTNVQSLAKGNATSSSIVDPVFREDLRSKLLATSDAFQLSKAAEISGSDIKYHSCPIEDMMSPVLLKLFDGGMVEEIKLRLLNYTLFKQNSYSICIRLLCPCQQCSLSPLAERNISVETQKNTYRVLKELFTSVAIASITRLAIPWQAEDCYVY